MFGWKQTSSYHLKQARYTTKLFNNIKRNAVYFK